MINTTKFIPSTGIKHLFVSLGEQHFLVKFYEHQIHLWCQHVIEMTLDRIVKSKNLTPLSFLWLYDMNINTW